MRPTGPFKIAFLTCVLLFSWAQAAQAFCGFYVSRADGDLFNEASKVVMVRDGDRTVITMVNDFQGDVSDFAMVIPAPTVLQREQIHVTDNALVDHLDAYTAPRLVEYFDPDPCRPLIRRELALSAAQATADGGGAARNKSLGVKVEASYTVGEYDILILSASQSDGLETWLRENGYRPPDGAGPVLAKYIAGGMKFFVAKINLEAHAKRGGGFLRPLQIAFESENFMLPIRLGMLNAKGPQDLLLFTLTRQGRVETANYRTARIPSDQDVPLYIRNEFGDFYRAMFSEAIRREGGSGVLLEYAWDMAWCDPCAADPLSSAELRELGVFWAPPDRPAGQGQRIAPQRGVDVFATRLHIRYDAESFPEDLLLRQTRDRQNFQGRYVMRHPFRGELTCTAGKDYAASLPRRFEREAQSLATMTAWDVNDIRDKMKAAGQDADNPPDAEPWWSDIWRKSSGSDR